MILLHGENLGSSRKRLGEIIDEALSRKTTIHRLIAKKLTPAELELALGASELFSAPKLIILEELHSLPTSKKKKAFIETISQFSQNKSLDNFELVAWEKRALTKTMLKKFPTAKVEEFPIKKVMFKWLEDLNGNRDLTQRGKNLSLFHQVVQQESEFLALVMLARQIRMLIQAKDGGMIKGPPFMISKLKKQADSFNLQQLLQLQQKLLQIDLKHKTSQSPVSLQQDIDYLLLSM